MQYHYTKLPDTVTPENNFWQGSFWNQIGGGKQYPTKLYTCFILHTENKAIYLAIQYLHAKTTWTPEYEGLGT